MFEDETAFVREWLCRLGGHVDARNRPFELVFAKTDRSSQSFDRHAALYLFAWFRSCEELWTGRFGDYYARTFLRSLPKVWAVVFLWLRARLSRYDFASCTVTFLERFRRCVNTHARAFPIVKHSYESGIRFSFLLRNTDIGQNKHCL